MFSGTAQDSRQVFSFFFGEFFMSCATMVDKKKAEETVGFPE
jgi:hypothetical protein